MRRFIYEKWFEDWHLRYPRLYTFREWVLYRNGLGFRRWFSYAFLRNDKDI